MKYRHYSIIAALGLLLVSIQGCDQSQNPATQYGDALIGAKTQAVNAADQAELDGLQKSVQAYQAANGSFPPGLAELSSFTGNPVNPDKYDYDPASGRISFKKKP